MSDTKTVTTPTQPVQSMSYVNPSQMTDMIMGNLLMSKLGSVMQTDFTLSVPNVLKLLLLLSAGEIKNSVSSALTQFVEYIKKVPDLFLNLVMFLSKFTKPRLQLQNIIEQKMPEDNHILTNIEVEKNFLISFCNYVLKNKNCSFKETLCKTVIKNTKDNVIDTKISNIVINFDDYSLKMVDSLMCGHDIYTNEIVHVEYNKPKQKTGTPDTYLDLLTYKQRKPVERIYNAIKLLAEKSGVSVGEYLKGKMGNMNADSLFTEHTIVNLLVKKYPKFDKDMTLTIIYIICSITHKTHGNYQGLLTRTRTDLIDHNKMVFDLSKTYSGEEVRNMSYGNLNIANFINSVVQIPEYLSITYIKLIPHFACFVNSVTSDVIKPSDKTTSLTFTITNNTNQPISPKQITSNFVKTIYGSYTKNSTKTKIHYIKLTEDVKTTEITNPEYEKYETKKRYLEQQKVADNTPNFAFFEFMDRAVPPRMITKETITKKIECKSINEVEKDFDTLFLRQEDKEQLFNSLNMFKNNGHVLKELGLQNKFNLLLHGEPGTGKSTTIQAVANYLQKDIYYIDLQKVETNEDLHMIFEYVNKNVTNAGIIVMEDIDAMTSVVLKRTDRLQEYKVSDIINNHKSKLSLEYLLNILQGTLTMDNSVFIVTTNHVDHLDPAFYRDGRFDVKIELKLCDKYQIKNIYERMLKKEMKDDVLEKIQNDKFSPAKIIYHIKNYIFNNTVDSMKIMEPFLGTV
jgi:AAA+ superfamily predicted ATPase